MKQRIVCAALLEKIGDDLIILRVRHFDDIMRKRIILLGLSCKNANWFQGFLDNKGQFLNRKEAFIVAKTAGQIIEKSGNKDSVELFSEDIY